MRNVLITGATSGIGEEFARVFARKGYRLILVARREDRMKALAEELDTDARIITADLSSEETCKQLLEDLKDEQIDVFINNAGFGDCGSFAETDLEKELSMIHVNDIAMHILFKGVLKKMQERDRGRILNVASSAGLLPAGPYMATYYATKAYMVSLTKAVAQELREAGSRIVVSALCPGPVDTEFNEVAEVKFALKGISAETCVNGALAGMRKHQTIIVPSRGMAFATKMSKFLPERIMIWAIGRQQRKKLYR